MANQRRQQFILLYGSMILTLILGIFTSSFNAKYLGVVGFGEFKLAQTLIIFLSTFLQMGFFVSAGRLIAQNKYARIEKRLLGGTLFIALVQSIVLIVVLLMFSSVIDEIFKVNLSNILIFSAPLLFAFPLKASLENIFQGNNSIGYLSVLRILPAMLYLMLAFLISYFYGFKVIHAFSIFLLTMFLTSIYFCFKIRPKFYKIQKSINIIINENKKYGLNVHIGVIAAVTTGQLSILLLGYLSGPESVGRFSIAQAVTSPLLMVPSCVATSYFKEFANSTKIDKKIIKNTLAVSIFSLFIFIVCIDRFIGLFFSSEFNLVINISYIMAIGSILHGFGDLFNRFIGAHGKGRLLKYGAILAGSANIIGCAILVPIYGLSGASFNVFLVGFVYLSAMYLFYTKLSCRLCGTIKARRE